MAEFSANIGKVDEDGGQYVTILKDGEFFSGHYIWDYRQVSQWTAQELGILRSMEAAGDELCEHGLSAGLCAGPQHYAYDADELEGARYF